MGWSSQASCLVAGDGEEEEEDEVNMAGVVVVILFSFVVRALPCIAVEDWNNDDGGSCSWNELPVWLCRLLALLSLLSSPPKTTTLCTVDGGRESLSLAVASRLRRWRRTRNHASHPRRATMMRLPKRNTGMAICLFWATQALSVFTRRKWMLKINRNNNNWSAKLTCPCAYTVTLFTKTCQSTLCAIQKHAT